MKKSKRLIVANWKMNPLKLAEARQLFLEIKKAAKKLKNAKVVVCPPYVYAAELSKLSAPFLGVGSQDGFPEEKGAYTGEVSMKMLAGIGNSHVIIGHSERRKAGESDEVVAKKIGAALKVKLEVILCIGEHHRDANGDYLDAVRRQLALALKDVPAELLSRIVIAYEPLWAIGKSSDDAVRSHDLYQMVIFIKKVLSDRYGKQKGMQVRVLYGGSVEPENAVDLIANGGVDGFLVGHASLKADQFAAIMNSAEPAS